MRKTLILLLLMLLYGRLGSSHNIHYHQLGSLHGLSQSSAISIWQDSLGRMWIGNDALNCYDGETVDIYRFSEYFPQVVDANIHTITGNESAMFVIAEDDLIFMDLLTEKLHFTGIKTHTVNCTADYAYYFAEGTFNKYDWRTGKAAVVLSLPETLTTVRAILHVGENRFWLGTPQGIFVVDAETGSIVRRLQEEEDISRLYKDSSGCIWIVSRSHKVYIVRNEPDEPEELSFGTHTLPDVLSVREDTRGNMWFGTLSGLYQLSRESVAESRTGLVLNHVLPESNIYALFCDRQGTLWIGSYYGNVRYFNPEIDNYVYYTTDEEHPERLHGAVIGKMAEDNQKNIYITTEGSGINILSSETGKIKHLGHKDGLRQGKIRNVWFDNQYERLYISEYMHGLSYYDMRNKKIHPIDNSALQTIYQQIIEEMVPYQHYLLLRTQNGIFRLNRRTLEITRLFEDKTLQDYCSGIIRAIHVDANNLLWVSSFDKGLFTIDLKAGAIKQLYGDGLEDKSFIPSAVVSFCEDRKKGLFMATLNSGILAYDPDTDTFLRFTEGKDQLLSDICYKICFSWYNNLIVTTSKGISILNLSNRNQLNSVHHIPLSYYFPLVALSGDCGLYSSKHSDKVYIGGLYGLLVFSEDDLVMDNANYSLYFSSLSINSRPAGHSSGILPEPLHRTKKIELQHRQNTINLKFASTNYLTNRDTPYEYKMEGIDNLWNVTNHKSITYNSLRPGKYKLTVREVRNKNKSSEIEINIKSPVWATAPAIAFYLLFAVAILLSVRYFIRSRRKLKVSLESKKEEMERMEEMNKNKIDFFINLSNEFRTPLTLILSQLDNLLHESTTTGQKKLHKIKTQAIRLQDLISELYDFRKMGENKLALHVENIGLNQFLRKIYLTYNDYANDKQIAYRYTHPDEEINAWLDPKQFQKVIYNLLSFVFRFGSRKDSIAVSLQQRTKWIEVSISYTGILPEGEPEKSFYSLINDHTNQVIDLSLIPEGGLGVIFSKGIMGLHHGNMSVQAANDNLVFVLQILPGNSHFKAEELSKDTGKAVAITLPEHPAETTDDIVDKTEKNGHDKPDMLLVEDNDEVRLSLKEIFSFNYNVIEMTNGNTAYEYAARETPDIVISEVVLQEINGIELCSMLRNNIQTSHIPVVLLTSHPSEKQQLESIRSGADDYIIKPFNIEMLILKCNSLIKSRKRLLEKEYKADEFIHEGVTNTRDKNFLLLAQQVIEENISNPDFDTSTWSKKLGIGRTRLFSQIKNITGMTPNEYILYIKLSKSLVLLKEYTLTVGEIAYRLGFSSPAYFSKCFKNQYGVTPVDYRKGL